MHMKVHRTTGRWIIALGLAALVAIAWSAWSVLWVLSLVE
jgi:hypothetical protein